MIKQRLGYHRVDVDFAPLMGADWKAGHVEEVADTLERFPTLRQALEQRAAVRAEIEAWRAEVPEEIRADMLPRLDHIHRDLGALLADLDGNATVQTSRVLDWRNHIAGELHRFTLLQLDERTLKACPGLAEALAGYVESGGRVIQACNTLLAEYPDARDLPRSTSRAHRSALASAIDAELER